jgi:hypothetical protein
MKHHPVLGFESFNSLCIALASWDLYIFTSNVYIHEHNVTLRRMRLPEPFGDHIAYFLNLHRSRNLLQLYLMFSTS